MFIAINFSLSTSANPINFGMLWLCFDLFQYITWFPFDFLFDPLVVHIFVKLPVFLLLLISNFIPLSLENMLDMISVF